jgi:hypothetical protein
MGSVLDTVVIGSMICEESGRLVNMGFLHLLLCLVGSVALPPQL